MGNAVWSNKELMFVTYEASPKIVWASTKTLKKAGEFDTHVDNLAGIAVDEGAEKIYVVKRDESYLDDLYVYSYDEVHNTLVLLEQVDLTYPNPVNPTSVDAWGLALDEVNGWLYVSRADEYVEVFSTSDWSHHHYITISVGQTLRGAVGIAVDPMRGYLYTGGFYAEEYAHNYLVRTQTSAPYTSIEVEITGGAGAQPVIGIGVDEDTGLVYCTTAQNDFRVYDSGLVLRDTETAGISGPAGVAVGGQYKQDVFGLSKGDGGVQCVSPEDVVNYSIQYSAADHPDTGVVITDYLPQQVEYVSSTGGGVYDAITHTVTWNLGSISGGASGTLGVQVQVNYYAQSGQVLTNTVEMEGDHYFTQATKTTDVCCYATGPVIYVDKDAVNGFNNGTSWDNAYLELRDALDQAGRCPGMADIWVAAGTYKPTTDPHDSLGTFALIDGVNVYGHFGGIGTYEARTDQRDFGNAANETILEGRIGATQSDAVMYVVTAHDLLDVRIDGFTIRGSYRHYDLTLQADNGAGVFIYSSYLMIANCTLEDNDLYGIYAGAPGGQSSVFDVEGCVISMTAL